LQPLEAAPGVRTVGELELMALLEQGAELVDSRVPGSSGGVTLPGAVSIPHDQTTARRQELDPGGRRCSSATVPSARSPRMP